MSGQVNEKKYCRFSLFVWILNRPAGLSKYSLIDLAPYPRLWDRKSQNTVKLVKYVKYTAILHA